MPTRPAIPLWTALPKSLDLLIGRMVGLQEYPVPTVAWKADCLRGPDAPDGHDWHRWRTGTFVAAYVGEIHHWSLTLRRCSACQSIEVRKEGNDGIRGLAASGGIRMKPLQSDELIGWYAGRSQ